MTPKQKKILDEAVKRMSPDEKVLTGGNKYINPKRKLKKKETKHKN